MKIYKTLKTALVLLVMIMVFLIIAWGVDDGWLAYPAIAIFIFVMVKYIWFIADEIRKTFFNND